MNDSCFISIVVLLAVSSLLHSSQAEMSQETTMQLEKRGFGNRREESFWFAADEDNNDDGDDDDDSQIVDEKRGFGNKRYAPSSEVDRRGFGNKRTMSSSSKELFEELLRTLKNRRYENIPKFPGK